MLEEIGDNGKPVIIEPDPSRLNRTIITPGRPIKIRYNPYNDTGDEVEPPDTPERRVRNPSVALGKELFIALMSNRGIVGPNPVFEGPSRDFENELRKELNKSDPEIIRGDRPAMPPAINPYPGRDYEWRKKTQ